MNKILPIYDKDGVLRFGFKCTCVTCNHKEETFLGQHCRLHNRSTGYSDGCPDHQNFKKMQQLADIAIEALAALAMCGRETAKRLLKGSKNYEVLDLKVCTDKGNL